MGKIGTFQNSNPFGIPNETKMVRDVNAGNRVLAHDGLAADIEIRKKTIRLKEIVFEKSGDLFAFHKFAKLYPPIAWADLKLLTLKREELARGMLSWTKSSIHAPLTQIEDKLLAKEATRVFKNELGYMGDKHYEFPNMLALELLAVGLQNHELRSEIYCQVIKQVTNNPSQDSARKGWELMKLCLDTFPPGPDFEDYLEYYLRRNANPAKQYYGLLHVTLYQGEKKIASNGERHE